MRRVLVAGIGNVFRGDDGFGVAVARLLAQRTLAAGVEVVDFGIRGLDPVYALLDGCDAAVLVDAVARGDPPGTLSVIAPEPDASLPDEALLSPHEIDPRKVLRLAAVLGCRCAPVLLVGCEAATFGDDAFGVEGLSVTVAVSVAPAADLVEGLARELTLEEAA